MRLFFPFACFGLLLLATIPARADSLGAAVGQSVQVSGHLSAAVAHALAASGKLTLSVVAVPLQMSGAVGAVSAQIGKDFAAAANAPIGTPLPISDEAISAGPPPNEAIQSGQPPAANTHL